MPSRRRATVALAATAALAALSSPAAAHAGALSPNQEPVSVPTWLFLMTGGGVVVASFLLTAYMTDREFIAAIHEWRRPLPGSVLARRRLAPVVGGVGVVGLVAVLVTGAVGPEAALANLAVVVVWAGWWSGYTMSVYFLGDSWPALNPWATVARRLPAVVSVDYPERLGGWPAVVGLLGLVWLEVVTPVSEEPRLLAVVVAGYTAVTLAGAVAVGPQRWFDRVDPISRVFRFYGRVAPIQRTEDGLALAVPGAGLTRGDLVAGFDDVAFVLALLWATTFDGLVATPAWAGVVRPLVLAGVPPLLAYLLAMLVGYGVFLGAFRLASRLVRVTGDSLVTTTAIERWFAPTLLPIAAGYHAAHFLDYFVRLLPTLATVLSNPLSAPPNPPVLTVPAWFGGFAVAFVILGHLLAVLVAHARAFDLFTGRLQPIRSQYPYILVMVLYTMTSLWLVAQPYARPPYT